MSWLRWMWRRFRRARIYVIESHRIALTLARRHEEGK